MSKFPVNKAEMVDYMAESAGISKAEATKALNAFLEAVQAALKQGHQVTMMGFGTFAVKTRAARTGRNPKTGEAIQIQAANVPVFKAGKLLKDTVNSAALVAEEA